MASFQELYYLKIPLQVLSDATNGFSEQNIVGIDEYWKVYKGTGPESIAVKILVPLLGQREHELEAEIAFSSWINKHENIDALLGFCDEDGQNILVYEYARNGSLDLHLSNTGLTWVHRLRICLDAALGLQYLHDGAGSHHKIVHRDIKSSNILVYDNWKAKISDFGLSRMGSGMNSTFHISEAGTTGYIDPDYLKTGVLTQESDVYSFGVVLFEVLCGRLARLRERTDESQFLVNLIKIHWNRETLDDIIHPDLHTQMNKASLLTFANIAYQCLMSRDERPTMQKVVKQLEKALEMQLAPSGLWLNDDIACAADDPQGQSGQSQESSSQSGPVSSHSWKYDVFISFRGEDTRKKFVDHLFSALEDRQVYTYKDDELLPQGETIGPSLFKAIQASRIAIVVFSVNYASSSWCLDELTFIMKNRDERGQTVLPVFYDIEPSEVRKQTSYYGEALAQHKLNNNNKVESWRNALVNASNISGWDTRVVANGHESKIIKLIYDRILRILISLTTHTEASVEASANTDLIGVVTRMQELKSFLKVGSGGVHMVGICGMWGTGKSTLASSIYNNISHEFEGCCFVKNVRAKSRMHGLKTLQEKILSNVLKSKVMLKSIEQGIYEMERRLSQNSVLIVLDDVHHIDHLKMLAGSKNWFGSGSRIIITSNNQNLLNAHSVIIRNVRLLDVQEAIELFSRHAFGESKPVQGFEDVSVIMISKFGGHPSALISLGSFLHGKDKSEWMSLLNRLIYIPANEILKKLETPDDGVARNTIPWFLT